MKRAVTTVVFDMDGVLCRYDFDARLRRLAELSGVDAETIRRVIFDEGFDEEGDRGRYTAEEYLRLFCERIGAPVTRASWLEARAISVVPDPEVLTIARALRDRVTLCMLTNNGPLLQESFGEVFPEAAEIFGEHAHFSCEFQTCKPDPEVFRRLLARLGADAAGALFIDDKAAYLEGAAAAGLETHLFRDAASLRATLEGYGLLP